MYGHFQKMVQSSLMKQKSARTLGGNSPRQLFSVDHPETSTTYVSNTMMREGDVVTRVIHRAAVQHILASTMLEPSILNGVVSLLFASRKVSKLSLRGSMPLI